MKKYHTTEWMKMDPPVSFEEQISGQDRIEETTEISKDMVLSVGENWQCKVCSKVTETIREINIHVQKHMKNI